MSQNLIEIKAEQLKWCRYGFTFFVNEGDELREDRLFTVIQDEKRVSSFDDDFIDIDETIHVDPIAYEKAVIDRIKEMIKRPIKIRKDMYQNIWVEDGFKKYGHPENSEIRVLVDPRPWESEYTIEVSP